MKLSKLNRGLIFVFLLCSTLLFGINVYTLDIETGERTISQFGIPYVMVIVSLCSFILNKSRLVNRDLIVWFLLALFIIGSVSTTTNLSELSNFSIWRYAQIVVMFTGCFLAFNLGSSFGTVKSIRLIKAISAMMIIIMVLSIILKVEYEWIDILVRRPYSWSFYFIMFYFVWFYHIDKVSSKNVKYVGLFITFITVILSGNRSVVLWILFIVCYEYFRKNKLKSIVILLVSMLTLSYWYLSYGIEILDNIQNTRFSSLESSRYEVWKKVIGLLQKDANYLIGNGWYIFNFSTGNESIHSAHNTYLAVLLSYGILGISVALLAFADLLKRIRLKGFILFLPIIAVFNELPLFPYEYSRFFEYMLFYFFIGILLFNYYDENCSNATISSIGRNE
jgi:hypothetical protein